MMPGPVVAVVGETAMLVHDTKLLMLPNNRNVLKTLAQVDILRRVQGRRASGMATLALGTEDDDPEVEVPYVDNDEGHDSPPERPYCWWEMEPKSTESSGTEENHAPESAQTIGADGPNSAVERIVMAIGAPVLEDLNRL